MAKANDEDVDSQNDEEDEKDDDATDDKKKVDESENSDSQNDNDGDDSADEDADDQDLKEKNKKLFARAKKAEDALKKIKADKAETSESNLPVKKTKAAQAEVGLTPMDAIILGKADITEQQDIEEVVKWANYNKISVAKALKDKTLLTILNERKEERQTAEATHTGGGRRGSRAPSADEVNDNASQGKFPDKPEDLAAARAEKRKNKK